MNDFGLTQNQKSTIEESIKNGTHPNLQLAAFKKSIEKRNFSINCTDPKQ